MNWHSLATHNDEQPTAFGAALVRHDAAFDTQAFLHYPYEYAGTYQRLDSTQGRESWRMGANRATAIGKQPMLPQSILLSL